MPPDDKSSEPGWLKQLWDLWKRFFDLILDPNWRQTAVWRRAWTAAVVSSAFCSFLHVFLHHAWLEFVPGWLIGECTLIALFFGVPLPSRLSASRLSMLALFAPGCTWLPYFIRLFFGSPDSHPFSDFFERKLGLTFVPQLFSPDPGDQESGALNMAGVCFVCTLASVATFAILAIWSARKAHRT
jgi:hypothetical protein